MSEKQHAVKVLCMHVCVQVLCKRTFWIAYPRPCDVALGAHDFVQQPLPYAGDIGLRIVEFPVTWKKDAAFSYMLDAYQFWFCMWTAPVAGRQADSIHRCKDSTINPICLLGDLELPHWPRLRCAQACKQLVIQDTPASVCLIDNPMSQVPKASLVKPL